MPWCHHNNVSIITHVSVSIRMRHQIYICYTTKHFQPMFTITNFQDNHCSIFLHHSNIFKSYFNIYPLSYLNFEKANFNNFLASSSCSALLPSLTIFFGQNNIFYSPFCHFMVLLLWLLEFVATVNLKFEIFVGVVLRQ